MRVIVPACQPLCDVDGERPLADRGVEQAVALDDLAAQRLAHRGATR